MEGIETPMTSGVATSVRPAVTTEAPRAVESSSFEGSETVVNNDSFEDFERNSDAILKSAKDEGFEKTLLDLADGAFDQEAEDTAGEDKARESDQEPEKEVPEDIKEEKELEDQIPEDEVKEPDPILKKFEDLNKEFEGLTDQIKEVQNRVSKVEDNYLSKEALLEALLILSELKKAEDEEEKLSLFELLVLAMTKVLVEIAPKENGEYEESAPDKKGGKKKVRSIDEIKRDLVARGMIRRPAVENQAA